ncbi:MAG TPA: hypothetical protein VNE82_24600 [Candidatus Binataceae bacterium]|nr:hypothetical protein [Candidatus Binataceae bacterium]
MTKGQAMTEFLMMGFVAFIILFVAIQMAAIGREYMALGQMNYQITRWATNPGNNSLKDAKGNAVNSPQCSDVVTLISGGTVSPYLNATVATGFMGKVASHGVSCTSSPSAGIGVEMVCTAADGSGVTSCATQRKPGVGVQITLAMDTSSILFLNLDPSGTNPNFLGIPFPKTLSSTQMMVTQ